MAVEFSVTGPDVKDLLQPAKYKKMAEIVAGESLVKLTGLVKEEAPKRDKNLRDSIDYEVDKQDPLSGIIYSEDCDYIWHVIYGTKPHEILPKNKKALYWDDLDHPVKKVYHPGTKPDDFPGRAIKRFNDSGFVKERIMFYTEKWKRTGRSARNKNPGTFIGPTGRKMGAGRKGGFL